MQSSKENITFYRVTAGPAVFMAVSTAVSILPWARPASPVLGMVLVAAFADDVLITRHVHDEDRNTRSPETIRASTEECQVAFRR